MVWTPIRHFVRVAQNDSPLVWRLRRARSSRYDAPQGTTARKISDDPDFSSSVRGRAAAPIIESLPQGDKGHMDHSKMKHPNQQEHNS